MEAGTAEQIFLKKVAYYESWKIIIRSVNGF